MRFHASLGSPRAPRWKEKRKKWGRGKRREEKRTIAPSASGETVRTRIPAKLTPRAGRFDLAENQRVMRSRRRCIKTFSSPQASDFTRFSPCAERKNSGSRSVPVSSRHFVAIPPPSPPSAFVLENFCRICGPHERGSH